MNTSFGRRRRRQISRRSSARSSSFPSYGTNAPTKSGTASYPRRVSADPGAARESHALLQASAVLPVPTWKRTLDLLLILLLLPLILPLALLVSCWIRLVSPGEVLFRQTRIGRGGKPFEILKFRSMRARAETAGHEAYVARLIRANQPMMKLDCIGDPRLITGGCFLRMSGLDELPQLINVIRGEMSLVGPRPCLPAEYEFYQADQRLRFTLQPGLTGLWQVERTKRTTFREMIAMDENYREESSLGLDLSIIFRTPPVLMGQVIRSSRQRFRQGQKTRSRRSRNGEVFGALIRPMSATQKFMD